MTVRIEKAGAVWTVIHDRPEARNAMDPTSAAALTAAFLEFEADKEASVAVLSRVRSRRIIRSASSISRRHGRVAMVAKFRADPWDLLGWSSTSRSSRPLRARPSLAGWNWDSGAISG